MSARAAPEQPSADAVAKAERLGRLVHLRTLLGVPVPCKTANGVRRIGNHPFEAACLAIAAFILLLPAFFLQALGYSGTCTQGANGPFLTGMALSFPFLLGCIALLSASCLRNMRGRSKYGFVLSGLGSVAVVVMAISILCFNGELAYHTLWLGISPCGLDHLDPISFEAADVMVGIVYAIMPALVAVMAVLTLWSALSFRAPNSN